MSTIAFPCLDEILTFQSKDLQKNISDVTQTWARLRKLHQTKTDHIDSATLIFLLPFSASINRCICKTVQDQHGNINWRFCLASVSLLICGSVSDKLGLVQQLYEKESKGNSFRSVLKDVLRCSQRIAISLNVEINASNSKFNIGSMQYHGEDNLNILVDELLTNYAETEACGDLQRPLKFFWSCLHTNTAFSKPSVDAPCSRTKHSACLNGHKIYLLGGRDGRCPVNDLWTYNIVTECWSKLKTSGETLPYLEEHTMVSYGNKLLVFGGVSRMSVDGETPLWILDTTTNVWRHWTSRGELTLPPCLKAHSAVLANRNMYIFGGYEELVGSTELMWSFDVVDEFWHLVYSQSLKVVGPSPRNHHTATLHNNSMIIVGGLNNLNPVTDMWTWSFRTHCWTKIKPESSNTPIIYNHATIKLSDSIFVYGGENESRLSKFLWEYRINSAVWKCKEVGGLSGPPSLKHHVGLLVPPSAYTALPDTNRTHSLPVMGAEPPEEIHRPPTCPSNSHSNYSFMTSNKIYPLHFHRNTLDLEPYKKQSKMLRCTIQKLTEDDDSILFNDKDNTNSKLSYSMPKGRGGVSKSDYDIVPYLRSGSQDALISQKSRTYSESSFTFVNPAYMNSYEQLTEKVDINLPKMPFGYQRNAYCGKLSRSLDSIQDVLHDSSTTRGGSVGTLPGTVLSHSEESVHETCTVRNIVLDDRSQVWEESWQEENIPELQEASASDSCRSFDNIAQSYKLFIIGGQKNLSRSSAVTQHLVMWRADITGKTVSTNRVKTQDSCMVS